MMTQKYLQVIGNMVVRKLSPRYPALHIRFFAGKRGDMMRVYIVNKNDQQQLTGRLFDVEKNPGLVTLRVKDMAQKFEQRIETCARTFQTGQETKRIRH